MLRHRLPSVATALAAGITFASAAEPLGNVSPADALKAFETEPGFAVELVAAEPLVVDPVALAFDERGRLFVAENRDYPTGSPDGRPLGVIALLEDTDRDGRMDQRTDFASGIAFPNGVMCWRGGVIVAAAPDVLWLKDVDGDGRADKREVLLTGFALGGSSQLRVNDPTLGPDGWIYFAGGLSGGTVFSPKHPAVKLDLARGDVRLNPDTGEIALVDGKSQFGLAFDDAGNRFACMNRVQVQHAPLPAKVLARNPAVASPGTLQDCPELIPNRLLVKNFNSAARLFPISANVTTADSHEGTYSAACAVHIQRGTTLPTEYHGAAFSCDPTANLVRGDRLVPVGGSCAAQRIHAGTEALRSRDNWFRPVFLADGPDGALYIADMYRGVIEHPVYLPDEVRKRTNFELGKDKGRIWRLTGQGASVRAGFDSTTNVTALFAALSSEVPWRRDTAFRLLRENMPTNLVPLLLAQFPKPDGDAAERLRHQRRTEDAPTNAAPAAGRCHALNLLMLAVGWTEANWDKAGPKQAPPPGLKQEHARAVLDALVIGSVDSSPAVRQTALRYLAMLPGLDVSGRILHQWAADPSSLVRLQVAVLLGRWNTSGSSEALARIALTDGGDKWTRAAVLSGLKDDALHFLDRMMQNPASDPDVEFMGVIGRLLGPKNTPNDLGQRHWTWAGGPGNDWKFAFWAGVATGLRGSGSVPATDVLAQKVGLDEKRWRELSIFASSTLADDLAPLNARLAALKFLAEFPDDFDRGRILNVVNPSEPVELQTAAVSLAAREGRLNCAREMLGVKFWAGLSPRVQGVAIGALLSARTNYPALLDALENGALGAAMLSPAQRDQLRKAPDEAVRQRAEKLFASAVPGDRQEALAKAKASLALTPVPANGRAVFTRLCAGCHRFNREGVAVGPDLFDIRNQSKETLLLHIVIPEQEIAPNFVSYECELTDGGSVSGLLIAESGASVTLRMAQGIEEVVPRARIARLTASRLSLMPLELEMGMTAQEMADLLAYMRGE